MSNTAEANEKTASNKAPAASFGPYSSGQGNSIELPYGRMKLLWMVAARSTCTRYRSPAITATTSEWKKTKTLRPQDIPVVVYALGKAQEWIFEHQRSTD